MMRRPAERTGTERRKKTFMRRKVCRFCADKKIDIDYKNTRILRYFVTERGKIIPRRISGNCAKHQRQVTVAIKRARNIAILPFTAAIQ
jgi:small subunit ribosomal protein S18